MSDGVSSNTRRCVDVKSCKVSGFKTHDYHLILQKLLPLVVRRILVRRILPEAVVIALIQLSNFFDALCSKGLVEADLNRLSSSIREAICQSSITSRP